MIHSPQNNLPHYPNERATTSEPCYSRKEKRVFVFPPPSPDERRKEKEGEEENLPTAHFATVLPLAFPLYASRTIPSFSNVVLRGTGLGTRKSSKGGERKDEPRKTTCLQPLFNLAATLTFEPSFYKWRRRPAGVGSNFEFGGFSTPLFLPPGLGIDEGVECSTIGVTFLWKLWHFAKRECLIGQLFRGPLSFRLIEKAYLTVVVIIRHYILYILDSKVKINISCFPKIFLERRVYTFGGETERSLEHDRGLFTRSSYHATRHAC